ncbi:patatin-like phospholipase family protein [Pseudonocardia sp. RS010]|uniref:patatin-like phospholipase family protein n=1 Tax=Pseudonocardia sp. RS010 TaxID=3385979 RepID=UPI0039A3141D
MSEELTCSTPEPPAPADLVLQGGGVKGIALAGAVDVLLRRYRVRRVAGTSAGAVLAALLAAGYTGEEVLEAMESLPYAEVPDAEPPIPVLGPAIGLLTANGLYRGDVLERWVADRLAEKGVHTFGDLPLEPDPKADPELSADDRAYRLVVTATDVTRGLGLRLPWDYREHFGLEPTEQSVAKAVRMSLSIPLFFVPCTLTNTHTGETSRIVDGGVLTNFPLELFDRQDGVRPRWPTFGVGVLPDLPGPDGTLMPGMPTRLPGPLGLVQDTLTTAVVGHDQAYLGQPRNAARLIRADTAGVGTVQFRIGREQRDELVRNGADAATDFLRSWDWREYLDRFFPIPGTG